MHTSPNYTFLKVPSVIPGGLKSKIDRTDTSQ